MAMPTIDEVKVVVARINGLKQRASSNKGRAEANGEDLSTLADSAHHEQI
jgi:hypothetical protein